MKVKLHEKFLFGKFNGLNFIDFGEMTDELTFEFIEFIKEVEGNKFLCGRNKKSSETTDKNQKKIVNKYNVWHYHLITEEQKKDENHSHTILCKELKDENDGIINGRIIHYINNSDKKIIVGFSPEHIQNQFPKLYTYPLNERIETCSDKNLIDFICHYSNYINMMVDNDNDDLISKDNFLEYLKTNK